jgi:hypothetical protein
MDKGLVFPSSITVDTVNATKGGLTKRELFAALLLSGRMSRATLFPNDIVQCVEFADRLVKHLEETGDKNE